MTTDVMRPEKLDIGRVIQTTFTSLQRNFVRLLPLIGIFIVLPGAFTLISSLSRGSVFAPGYVASPLYFANLVVGLFAWAAFQGAGILILVSDMRGETLSVGDSVRRSLVHILPLFAIVILYFLAVWAGSILLLVPGVMIAVAFSVAIQARVVERKGVFAAFGRSRFLTRGNRWRITGLILVYVIFLGVIEMVIVSLFGGFAGLARNLDRGAAVSLSVILQILGLAFGLIGLAGSCSLYAELRRIKDGVGASDLAAVFD